MMIPAVQLGPKIILFSTSSVDQNKTSGTQNQGECKQLDIAAIIFGVIIGSFSRDRDCRLTRENRETATRRNPGGLNCWKCRYLYHMRGNNTNR